MASDPDLLLARSIRGRQSAHTWRPAICVGVCSVVAVTVGLPALGKEDGGYFTTGFERVPRHFRSLSETLSLGARAEISFEADVNPDLDSDEDDDESAVEPELFLGGAWEPTERIDVVIEGELSQKFLLERPDDDDPDLRLQLRRAYATIHDVAPGTTLVVGRQNFVDERKWLWEEPLDGARVFWQQGRAAVELAAARDGFVRRNLLERRNEDGGNYFWGAGRWASSEDSIHTAYALFVDDRDDMDEDLLFLGVQSMGELHDDIDYWLESAVVSGEEDGRDVLGFGLDVGGTWTADLPLEPAVTLGIAFGTGDDGEGTDNAFRQTGLEENSDSFGGLASFDYYGEVLDPELSNIVIATAGIGIRPTRTTSVDLVYHHYRQVETADTLMNAAIDADPNGDDAGLGNELDLVLGWRASDRVRLKGAAGVFLPGEAFDNDDPALRAGFEMEIRL